jgi:hypothetical protein
MSKLASRTAAVVGDLVDTCLFWFDTASSAASYRATWLVIRTKLADYFATVAQGALADSAVQPADISDFQDEAEVDARVALYQPIPGTFTPTVQDASLSNSEGQTYTEQLGYSRQTGDVMDVWIDITINSLGTLNPSDAVVIAGLPEPCNANIRAACSVGLGLSLNITAGNAVTGYVVAGQSHIALLKWSATAGTPVLTVGDLSSGGRLLISARYFL